MRTVAIRAACLGLIVTGSGLIVASAKATGSQHERNQPCCLATLRGLYVFSANGSNETTPLSVAGSEVFNGDGTFSGVVTLSEGGSITPNASFTGTYTVNPDCSGTETITGQGGNPDQHFSLFILPTGKQFRWIETDPGISLAGDEVRSEGRNEDRSDE